MDLATPKKVCVDLAGERLTSAVGGQCNVYPGFCLDKRTSCSNTV